MTTILRTSAYRECPRVEVGLTLEAELMLCAVHAHWTLTGLMVTAERLRSHRCSPSLRLGVTAELNPLPFPDCLAPELGTLISMQALGSLGPATDTVKEQPLERRACRSTTHTDGQQTAGKKRRWSPGIQRRSYSVYARL